MEGDGVRLRGVVLEEGQIAPPPHLSIVGLWGNREGRIDRGPGALLLVGRDGEGELVDAPLEGLFLEVVAIVGPNEGRLALGRRRGEEEEEVEEEEREDEEGSYLLRLITHQTARR